MSTTVPTAGRASAKTASAQTPATTEVASAGVSRREFLYYIWGASMALLLAESTGAMVWFMLPRFRAGEFGGVFALDPATLPVKGSPPVGNPAGKYWLSNTDHGLYALSMVCTHLGCLFKWVPANNRFECPCHGSKFTADGNKIVVEGPAQRNLDRFVVTVTTPAGPVITDADGHAVSVDGATSISIDTGKKLQGKAAGTTQ
jgi:cytochrome b6-f complex iron-sulfur subunit